MKCLVTGGTGFIGSNLALDLSRQGHEVIITGNESEQQLPEFKCLYPGLLGIDWDAIGTVDVIFHQAAINGTRTTDRSEMLRANVDASMALFEYGMKHGCRRIVYASSTAVYGRTPPPYRETGPFDLNTPYAESKKKLDDYAMSFALKHPDITVVGLRYCNVYGPGENHKGARATMIYQFVQQMKEGNPRLFKHGEQKRDYIYINDVVRANMLAATATDSCIVNCGSGDATSFNQIVELLNNAMGIRRLIRYIDNPYGDNYQHHTECDMTLAKDKIGFAPQYTIEEGIREYFASVCLKCAE
jgi:ADP-L-glycero-D-manno-heptose 6-epimerase